MASGLLVSVLALCCTIATTNGDTEPETFHRHMCRYIPRLCSTTRATTTTTPTRPADDSSDTDDEGHDGGNDVVDSWWIILLAILFATILITAVSVLIRTCLRKHQRVGATHLDANQHQVPVPAVAMKVAMGVPPPPYYSNPDLSKATDDAYDDCLQPPPYVIVISDASEKGSLGIN